MDTKESLNEEYEDEDEIGEMAFNLNEDVA